MLDEEDRSRALKLEGLEAKRSKEHVFLEQQCRRLQAEKDEAAAKLKAARIQSKREERSGP